jgi:dephospho-CoA kinase
VEKPFLHCEYSGLTMLGGWRPEFCGSDMLSFSRHPKIKEFLEEQGCNRMILVEGDRLNSNKFLKEIEELGFKIEVIYITVVEKEQRNRLKSRSKVYSEAWLKGRQTKFENKAKAFDTITINGEMPIVQVVKELKKIISGEQALVVKMGCVMYCILMGG